MNIIKAIFLSTLLSLTLQSTAQSGAERRGDKHFKQFAFSEAIQSYSDVVAREADNQRVMLRLGDCYRMISDFSPALEWYSAAAKVDALPDEYLLHYAQMLQIAGRCSEAGPYFESFAERNPEDKRALFLKETCEKEAFFARNKGFYAIVHPKELNSEEADFGPAFYKEGIVFASARTKGSFISRKHAWNNAPFLDLYFASDGVGDNTQISRFSGDVNTRFHEGPLVFDGEQDRIYFTRNNLIDGKLGKSSNGTIKLKILSADAKDGKLDWESASELPFCSDEYSVAHPTLSPDGKRMYFISDMPGGYGNTDIYFIDRLGNEWSHPVNLGPEINTEGEESFPFLHDDGTLYFASDGHAGLGGLDIFGVKLNSKDEIENLGAPINTPFDDFGLIWNQEREMGYFASNRPESLGSDDIFMIEKTASKLDISIVNSLNGFPLKDATIFVREIDQTFVTSSEGQVEIMTPAESLLHLTISHPDFNMLLAEFETGPKLSEENMNLELKPLQFFEGFAKLSSGEAVGEVPVSLMDSEGNLVATTTTEVDGSYKFEQVPDGDYTISIEPGSTDPISLEATAGIQEFVVPGPPTVSCELPVVYYDLDKSFIRSDAVAAMEQVLEQMKNSPELRIIVASHTDSRASNKYNEKLANQRTQSAISWLTSRGIEQSRIESQSFGEYQLTNHCKNGEDCSEQEHQLNRRTTFQCLYSR